MRHHSSFWKAIIVIVVVGILVSVPVSIYISGRARNAKNNELCAYQQHQWRGFHAIVLRFTPPGSEDRLFLTNLFGPYPNC